MRKGRVVGSKKRNVRSATTIKGRRSFDLLLKNGRVVDPANEIDGIRDIGIKDGRIVAVEPEIPADRAGQVRDVSGLLVLPGLIDTHAHVFEYVSGDFGLNADAVGVRSGVTTIVDQGGPSALTIDGFRKFIIEASDTNVLCFISAYLAGGLHGHRYVDLYGPTGINVDAVVSAGKRNRDIVRGIKAHAEPGGYSRWGVESLKLAKKASRRLGIPVYIHLGTLWSPQRGAKIDPRTVIEEIDPLLDEGDILAHPFTRYPSGFVSPDGEIHPVVFRALERGVRLDVGHGSHFSFHSAKAVIKAGIRPFTLGADMHGYNVGKAFENQGTWISVNVDTEGAAKGDVSYNPTFSLYTAMSELVALGVDEADVIKMVTSNAAELLELGSERGSLGVGRRADISVIAAQKGRYTLKDSSGETIKAKVRYRPVLALHEGKIVELDSPLLPRTEKQDRSRDGAASR